MVDQPFFIVFDVAAVVVLGWWLWKLVAPTHHFVQHWRWRLALLVALALGIASILFVLRTWASFDVVDDPFYIVGYLTLGVAWISLSAKVLHGSGPVSACAMAGA